MINSLFQSETGLFGKRWTALQKIAQALLFRTLRSKSLLGRAWRPLGARDHSALEIISYTATKIIERIAIFKVLRKVGRDDPANN